MTNQTLLESVEGLKNKTISGILRMTEQVGLGIFTEATVVPDEFGYYVRVRNEAGKTFYFCIDDDNFAGWYGAIHRAERSCLCRQMTE